MKIKNLLIKLLLPVLSVSLFFVFTEGAFRLLGVNPTVASYGVEIPFWARNAGTFGNAVNQVVRKTKHLTRDVDAYEADWKLFYKLRPNISITVPFYDMSGMKLYDSYPDWTIHTDQNGLRCRSEYNEPQGDIVNIAFLGGSSLFGWGVNFENTCVAELETRLNEQLPKRTHQCTNYAVPGYSISQHIRILNKLIAEKNVPHYIVLDATSNCDVQSPMTDRAREEERLSIFGCLRFFMSKLRIFNLMEILAQKIFPKKNSGAGTYQTPRIPLDEYGNYLTNFISLTKKHGIDLFLIGMCVNSSYVEKMEQIAEDENIPYLNFYHLVQHTIRDMDSIPFLDDEKDMYQNVFSHDVLGKKPFLYLLFPDRCHPNATGHRILAQAIRHIHF